MIQIKLLSGLFASRMRKISEGIGPREFLYSIYRHGWRWEIDYSAATEAERILWGREDMALRCVRALLAGRPVEFLGKSYTGPGSVGVLEDDIVNSKRLVQLVRDDETGVVIAVAGYEQ